MSTLSVLIEASSCSWGKLAEEHGEKSLAILMRSIISFCNAHLAISAANQLLVFAYGRNIKDKLIFSSTRPTNRDVSTTIVSQLRRILTEDAKNPEKAKSVPLAPSMAHAICHMKRCVPQIQAAALNPDSLGHQTTENTDEKGTASGSIRAVVIGMTSDFGSEHAPLMNLFFSAAKQNICVDVVSLGDDVTGGILQQTADITGGLFLHARRPVDLLPMMMTHILAEPGLRKKFAQPKLEAVDYRASCACHHQLVSTGWVCSVCLSVLCQFTPICRVCKSAFNISHMTRKALKRKI